MNPLVTQMLSSLCRQIAIALGAWLVSRGVLKSGDTETFVSGAVVLFLGVATTLYTVYKKRVEKLSALAAPRETSETELHTLMSSPDIQLPPASLPRDEKPFFEAKVR